MKITDTHGRAADHFDYLDDDLDLGDLGDEPASTGVLDEGRTADSTAADADRAMADADRAASDADHTAADERLRERTRELADYVAAHRAPHRTGGADRVSA